MSVSSCEVGTLPAPACGGDAVAATGVATGIAGAAGATAAVAATAAAAGPSPGHSRISCGPCAPDSMRGRHAVTGAARSNTTRSVPACGCPVRTDFTRPAPVGSFSAVRAELPGRSSTSRSGLARYNTLKSACASSCNSARVPVAPLCRWMLRTSAASARADSIRPVNTSPDHASDAVVPLANMAAVNHFNMNDATNFP